MPPNIAFVNSSMNSSNAVTHLGTDKPEKKLDNLVQLGCTWYVLQQICASFERWVATLAHVLVHLKFKVHLARVDSCHLTLSAYKAQFYLFIYLFIYVHRYQTNCYITFRI